MIPRCFVFACGIGLSVLVAAATAKEPEKLLEKSLEVLSRGEKRTLDFGEEGSLTFLTGRPEGPHLGAYRIDVGSRLRVYQGTSWNALSDEEFEKTVGFYCMASRGESPVPFIQVEIDESTDVKVLARVCDRLLKVHLRMPQLEPIKYVYVSKRTAPAEARQAEKPAGK